MSKDYHKYEAEEIKQLILNREEADTINLSDWALAKKMGFSVGIDFKFTRPSIHDKPGEFNITNEGALVVADYLKEDSVVEYLDLNGNMIGDLGALALAEMIKSNKKLKHFTFGGRVIGEKGIEAFADAVEENFVLTTLGIRPYTMSTEAWRNAWNRISKHIHLNRLKQNFFAKGQAITENDYLQLMTGPEIKAIVEKHKT